MDKEKILVVDDEEQLADMIKLNLEAVGKYEVKTENDGGKVISVVKDFKPDLVLLDIRMPGVDGIEVLRQIKQLDAKIQVVMATAVEEDWVGRLALKIGAFEYITKPFDVERIRTVLSVALSMRKE